MAKKTFEKRPETAGRRDHILKPHAALLAHHDAKTASELRDIMEDVACDWTLAMATDGANAARLVMSKGLPDLLLIEANLPKVNGPDFVEWIRTFGHASSISILVVGQPETPEGREQLLRNDVPLILAADAPREIFVRHLSQWVTRIEKRRLLLPSMLQNCH